MRPVAFAVLICLLPLGLAAQTASPGVAAANVDTAVKPGDDFYLYANGKWQARTEIPPDRSSVGIFSELGDLSDKRVAGIIDEAVKSAGAPVKGKVVPKTDQRRMADLYRSYVDES